MRFIATADTDIGNTKSTNQDSVLIEHASTPAGEVLMTVICDGMGGLSKGELASATVIRAFKAWFDKILPFELVEPNMQVIGNRWSLLLKELNVKIMTYPDFDRAGLVEEKVDVGEFSDSRSTDFRNAETQTTKPANTTWHHSEDGHTLEAVSTKYHKMFTHRGGFSIVNGGK